MPAGEGQAGVGCWWGGQARGWGCGVGKVTGGKVGKGGVGVGRWEPQWQAGKPCL